MRLLDTKSVRLRNDPHRQQKYAILSHRWGDDEVVFDDMITGDHLNSKPAFAKIQGFCNVAHSMGLEYGWADNCCINKSSSSELSEAINSMFNWYAEAEACIIHLADVGANGKSFEQSDWFSRGWTLQELIAPKEAIFYDMDWMPIGNKRDLAEKLNARTGIPKDVLQDASIMFGYSIAQRMSWAAHRETTRMEDQAYSLMGLFGVNMDMRYGERDRAFLRLQEEIVKVCDDESIFAWPMDPSRLQSPSGTHTDLVCSSLLAPSPMSFVDCADVTRGEGSLGAVLTSAGIRLKLRVQPYSMERYKGYFRCFAGEAGKRRCGILLAPLSTEGHFTRIMTHDGTSRSLDPVAGRWGRDTEILIRTATPDQVLRRSPSVWLRTLELPKTQGHYQLLPRGKMTEDRHFSFPEGVFGSLFKLRMKRIDIPAHNDARTMGSLEFGFDSDCAPAFCASSGALLHLQEFGLSHPPQRADRFPAFTNCSYWDSDADKSPEYKGNYGRWKGTRAGGLREWLSNFNLKIEIQLLPHASWLASAQATEAAAGEAGDIWVIDITPINPSSGDGDCCGCC